MVAVASTKICNGCEKELSIDEFTKDRSKGDGLRSRCKECCARCAKRYGATSQGRKVQLKANRKYLATERGKKKHREQHVRFYVGHLERVLLRRKQYYGTTQGKEVQRRAFFRSEYNSTLEEYQQMFEDQNGQCKICGIPQTELNERLDADHDLVTGDTRGLLCKGCNLHLNRFEKGYPYGTKWTRRFEKYLGIAVL